MPPKESQKLSEIYVLEPDGTKIKLGDVRNFSIISDDSYLEDPWDPNPITMAPQEFEFTANRLSTELLYFITHGKLPSNNWLRMHGEGPRRTYRKKNRKNRKR